MEVMNARNIPNGEGVVYNEATPISHCGVTAGAPIYWRFAYKVLIVVPRMYNKCET